MASETEQLVDLQWDAASELEHCAAYAAVIAKHLRSSTPVSDAENATLVNRFQHHGKNALGRLAEAGKIIAMLRERQAAHQQTIEAAHATRH